MRAQQRSLWSYADFRKLWGSDTISLFGLHATLLALPLTAVSIGVTTLQLGLLTTAQTAPALLFGLFTGVWVDRCRRRPLLIGANIVRAMLLTSIPVAAYFGILHLAQLYLVAFLSGIAGLVFVVAYQAFLPMLVPREQLVAGNSALRASEATAQFAGPSVGGLLVQILSAPMALTVGAVASLGSALAILTIRASESCPRADDEGIGVGRAIGEGVHFVLADPILRPLLLSSTLGALFSNMPTGIYLLYAIHDVGISAATLGVIVSAGGLPALLAALLTGRAVRRYGIGTTLIAASAVKAGATLLLPLAGGPIPVAIALLLAWRMLTSLAETIGGIASFTLVQVIPPLGLQGRVNATVRVCGWGAIALGGVLGGISGELFGLRPTLILAAFGTLSGPLWLIHSRVRHLRDIE
jgi:MFS family permease